MAAYSFVQYPVAITTTGPFNVSFPYIAKYQVEVRKNTVLLVDGVDYTWPTTSTIQLVANAVNGDTIEIRRNSLKKSDGTVDRLVDWANSAKITEANLDKADLQCFYLAQEALDAAANAMQLVSDSTFDATSKRIKNVANPTLAQDAATKNYVDLLALGSFPSPLAVGSGGTGTTAFTVNGIPFVPVSGVFSSDSGLRFVVGPANAGRDLLIGSTATAGDYLGYNGMRCAGSVGGYTDWGKNGARDLTAYSLTSGGGNVSALTGDFSFGVGNPGNWVVKGTAGTGYGVLTSTYGIDSPLPGVAGSARNLAARTDATTPNSKVNVTADQVVMWTTGGTGGRTFPSVNVTADMAVTGANGLDVAGETANTWYYVWLIGKWDGSSTAALISLSSTAPTMPAGYTHRTLVGAVRNDGSSNFLKFRQRGNEVFFENPQIVVNGGGASTETVVSCASFVPPIAHTFTVNNLGGAQALSDGAGNIDFSVYVRLLSGVDYQTIGRLVMSSQGATQGRVCTVAPVTFPNISQQFYYYYTYSAGTASGGILLYVQSFKLPLGGE